MAGERRTYDVKTVMRLTGLGRTAVYAAMASGELESVRIGGRVLVLKEPLDAMLDGKTKPAPKAGKTKG